MDSENDIYCHQIKPDIHPAYKNITTKILTETSEISSEHLPKIWNQHVIRGKNFPNELKLADITPIFRKEESTMAKN